METKKCLYCTEREWCDDCLREIALKVSQDNPGKLVVTAKFEVKNE